ncbi:hypothetical protein [Cohnella yongneupensis]|uniref:Uncharacterized protein n=1 Tax=Cohnella yongneupensis TaxID=425006 RepID=A0ABW0QZ29_9BACL
MLLLKGQSILFIEHVYKQQSVTNNGERTSDSGMATIADRLLQMVYPELSLQVEACASGIHTLDSAVDGWLDAARRLRPDWLVIPPLHGDNWPAYSTDGRPLTPDLLEAALRRMMRDIQPYAINLALVAPISLTSSDKGFISPYADVARSVAEEEGCLFIDAQAEIDDVRLKYAHQAAPTNEELSADIEMSLTNVFLQAIGFQWVRRNAFAVTERPSFQLSCSC